MAGFWMDEQLAFLRAQLDEDERVISGSGDLGWLTIRQPDGTMDHTEAACRAPDGAWIVAGRERIGYASARVVHRESDRLAEVEAKRRVLAVYAEAVHLERVGWENDEPSKYEYMAREEALGKVVKLLAQPYAGRPGWREEWAA